ncbi:hypothetical protein PWT90_10361 [Aphanocladium album]|nr:hypothetical protein PWT90_10361 [Aphanocladium album]
MTEAVGLAAGPGPRGSGGTKTATAQAIASAIPGPRSAVQGRPVSFQGSFVQGGRRLGHPLGHSPGGSALPGASVGRYYTLSSTGTTAGTTEEAASVTTAAGSPSPGSAARLAKTRLPVSTSTSTAPEGPSHRQPRSSYLRTRASSSLAASSIVHAAPRPASRASASISSSALDRPRRPSHDSAVSLDDRTSSPPPGSSPPSSVGQDIQAPSSPSSDDKPPASCASPLLLPRHRHRQRSSSFDLPLVARPRPRAYSDQGPRPDVSRPPQTFYYLRRSSNPEPPVGRHSRLSPASSHSSLLSRSSREPASFSAKGISTSAGPPPSINGRLLEIAGDDADFSAIHHNGNHYNQQPHQPRFIPGSRNLLPLKTAAQSATPNEPRRRSVQHSYRLSLTGSLPTNATPTRVPPIRSFRSSGSRKSLHILDMNFTPRPYDLHESAGAPLYDEDHARAATAAPDSRYDRQSRLMTPPVSGRQAGNGGEESGDVFLRLAREDALNRTTNGRTPDGTYSPVSATHRSWHRRPLSTNVASYQPLSPPKLRRRLSDQQERPYLGNLEDDQTSQTSRVLQYRSKAASAHPGEAASQFAPPTRSHRPPPLSSRSPVYHDNSDNYRHTRRRSSVTESTPPISGRGQSSYKTGAVYNYSKTYSSSPLVRTFDLPPPQTQEPQNGVEGTESTASTTAPSTVWDQLDELKSRINRLEITGKLPSTSGAAVTKMSDERPVTANTTVTTASISPKRQVHVHTDDTISVAAQTVLPNLQNALVNCKLNLSPEVYKALDSVAQDALGLSAAMGHGPIPSGASTIGTGSNASDRHLRRKADSVCRSLTELCITLNDDAAYRASAGQQQAPAFASGTPSTPTFAKSHSGGLPVSRRSSVVESNIPLSHTSPRVMSRFEERRNSLLHGAGPPVSLHSNPNNAVPNDNSALGRHSSLFVSRTRQARQEEPDDGRESALSRSRRALTEEPEDGRKSTRSPAHRLDAPSPWPTRPSTSMPLRRMPRTGRIPRR